MIVQIALAPSKESGLLAQENARRLWLMKEGMRTSESARMPASPILLSSNHRKEERETVEKQRDDVGKEVVIDEHANQKQPVVAQAEIPEIHVLQIQRELRVAVLCELFVAVRRDFEA